MHGAALGDPRDGQAQALDGRRDLSDLAVDGLVLDRPSGGSLRLPRHEIEASARAAEVKLGPKEVDQTGLPIGDALSLSGCSVEGSVAPSCSDVAAVAAAYGRALAVETAPFLGALPRPAVDPWIEARDVAKALEPFDDVAAGVVFAAADEFNDIMREVDLNAADQKKRQDFLRKIVQPVAMRLSFEDVPQPSTVPDLGDIGDFTP